ncbi:uncharacterized protein LOC123564685 [Mercenaria mercenaria]|uniref:uncharacterized protein LOC123564685 n=1 Tax=Mercenaria mercenaria TaxID=6596 RepID=UPI00234FAA17|nr:uncharacterized protein LOC123564685 [Mercenaria mercenaria]
MLVTVKVYIHVIKVQIFSYNKTTEVCCVYQCDTKFKCFGDRVIMNKKKTLITALGMTIVLMFIALLSDFFKPVAKRAPPPVSSNTKGQMQISFLSGDKNLITEADNGTGPILLTRKSSEIYYQDIRTGQTQSNAKQKSFHTTITPALTKTTDSITDSENKNEATHIEFLKVHKAASSTAQSIILRFGLKRNLSFVIPTPTHYISTQKYFFSDIWPPLPEKPNAHQRVDKNIKSNHKYDILSHHMVFNHKKVSQLLYNDTVYVAIVRDPFDLFISSACYYKFALKSPYPYLGKLSNETFITDLIRNPKQNEATTMSESMTFNSMAYDFGMSLSLRTAEKITEQSFVEFLNKTGNIFHLVMVVEKFDESLVLLKRYLNWTLQDILYIKINTFSPNNVSNLSDYFGVTADDMTIFRKRNKFDYGIYNFFKDRLEKQISKEEFFTDEVEHFKVMLRDVQKFCSKVEAEQLKAKECMQNTDDSLDIKYSEGIKNNNTELENSTQFKNQELLKSINLIITTKNVSAGQKKELHELFELIESDSLETTTMNLSKLLPLLFRDRDCPSTRESKLLVPESKWNKNFYVTSRDCDIMTKDIMSLYEIVKQNHLKVQIEDKFGNNFSIIEVVKYLSTFT